MKKEVLPDFNGVLGDLQNYVTFMSEKLLTAQGGAMVKRASQAIALLEPQAKALADGRLTGDMLAALTRAGRELEAVARLASPVPVPRANPAVCHDPANKVVVLFGGDRFDCKNHTYHNYAYDPLTSKVVAATYGGTGVFDPDTGRWAMSIEQPFSTSHYTMNLFTTPEGILVWAEGFFGTFNARTMKYTPVKVTGDLPGYLGPDKNGACWDSKRKVMWLFATKGWREADGQVWKLDLDQWTVESINPANMETIGKATIYLREMVYLPEADLVLSKAFHGKGESARQIAWDPAANRWVLTNIHPIGRVEGPVAMIHDTKRDLVWCMSGGRQTYVLRVDPKALKLSNDPAN